MQELDLRPLSQVTVIEESFLYGCTGLIKLDLSPLSQVTVIHKGFLAHCRGLKELDLRPLSNVTEIIAPSLFVYDCTNLEEIKLPRTLYNLLRGTIFLKNFKKRIIIVESMASFYTYEAKKHSIPFASKTAQAA